MNAIELIGLVGAAYLRRRFAERGSSSGTSRFFLDQLTTDECVGIVNAVLQDAGLADKFYIRLPRSTFAAKGLPDELLTDERSTYFRNLDVPKPALLLAFVGDDEGQSLRELTPVGALDLRRALDLWIEIAGKGLPLTEIRRTWWQQAVAGLIQAHAVQIEELANFVLATRRGVEQEGMPIEDEIGRAH